MLKFTTRIRYLLIAMIAAICCTCSSCASHEEPQVEETDRTLIMYFPWSDDLTSYFRTNISDMKEAIAANGLDGQRVIVAIANGPDNVEMYEITTSNGSCSDVDIKNYTNPDFTVKEWISGMLTDIKTIAPAKKYSIIIGCHGMGWLPVSSTEIQRRLRIKTHMDYSVGNPSTRYFGGYSDSRYKTEISTLAQAISDAGMKMEYILFDDCYMATAEVAYELRNATEYIIASTSEVASAGLPYKTAGGALLGNPDYEAVCKAFHDYYATSFGSLSVIDCSKIEEFAALMKEANSQYDFDKSKLGNLQRLDGYSPIIFFDLGSYAENLIPDAELRAAIEAKLHETVIHTTSTSRLYSASYGYFKVDRNSGICISDPSVNPLAAGKEETDWYKATH